MAQGRKTREQQRKKLARRRRSDSADVALVQRPSPKLASKIEYAYELIRLRNFEEAKDLVETLGQRYSGCAAVIETQVYLYQRINDHERCSQAAKQLAKLTPNDPDARMLYAQESMYCERIGIALANYRLFLDRWPDHSNASKARTAIELVEPESDAIIKAFGFAELCGPKVDGLALLVLHDEIRESIQFGRFDEAAGKCLELLKAAPEFTAARNNLAISYFQHGKVDLAVQVVEETFRRAPDNRFAEATLGKLRFLSGHEAEAHEIADRIVADPRTGDDSLVATTELLSYLGRDADIVAIAEAALVQGLNCSSYESMLLHHLAVAQCRLGDENAARSSWKKCLKASPSHPEAQANLDDLNSNEGHAPWPESVAKWIPKACLDAMLAFGTNENSAGNHLQLKEFPAIASLIPALLNRGDAMGRTLAMKLAVADGSPEMLDALHQFAFGTCGPDAMRFEALNFLGRKGRVDSGPHRVYVCGKWTEIRLFMAEINWDVQGSPSRWVQRHSEIGSEALNRGDFTLAEETFEKILERHPDNCSAAYNLTVVWARRDGSQGARRARRALEELHERFPEYVFATISLAQFMAMDGDLDRADELLDSILRMKKLHASEAIVFFTASVQVSIERRELETAEHSLSILTELAHEDDPNVQHLRRHIDNARRRSRLSRWIGGK